MLVTLSKMKNKKHEEPVNSHKSKAQNNHVYKFRIHFERVCRWYLVVKLRIVLQCRASPTREFLMFTPKSQQCLRLHNRAPKHARKPTRAEKETRSAREKWMKVSRFFSPKALVYVASFVDCSIYYFTFIESEVFQLYCFLIYPALLGYCVDCFH